MTATKVLLIDNDRIARRHLARCLRRDGGFEVDDFGTGQEGMEALRAAPDEYTVVVTDLVLKPVMTGYEVLEAVTQQYPDVPVVVITGRDAASGTEILAQGAYSFLMRTEETPTQLVGIIRHLAQKEALFPQLAADVRRMLGSDLCIAWRWDQERYQLRVAGWHGQLDEAYRNTATLDLSMTIPQTIFADGEPHYFRDVRDHDSAPEYQYREEAIERGWVSLVSIPLIYEQRILGLVDSYTYRVWEPSQAEGHILENVLPAYAEQAARAIRSAQMEGQIQTLQSINRMLAGITEEKALMDAILGNGMDLIGADAGWIYLLDREKQALELRAHRVPGDVLIPETSGIGAGITGRAVESEESRYVEDVSADVDDVVVSGLDVRSVFAVLLKSEEEIVGVLTVSRRLPDAFSSDDRMLLRTLATQAAIVVEREHLTSSLQEISRMAFDYPSTMLDDQAIAGKIVGVARGLLGGDVILWRAVHKAVSVQEQTSPPSHLEVWDAAGNVSMAYRESATIPLDPEMSVVAQAWENGEILTHRNIQEAEGLGFSRLEGINKENNHKSFMAVPLMREKQEKLGVLTLLAEMGGKFTEADRKIMDAFASQAAVALGYAHAFQREQRLRQRSEKLRSIAARIDPTSGLEELGSKILDELRKVVGYRQATVQLIAGMDLRRKRIASRGIAENYEDDAEWALKPVKEDPLIKRMVEKKSPLIFPDVSRDRDWTQRPQVAGVRSWAGIPLVYRGEVIGLITLDYDKVGTYTEQDGELLGLFATQVAAMLASSRAYQRTREQFQTLRKMMAEMGAGEGEDPLIAILQGAAEVFEVPQVSLALVDHEVKQLVYHARIEEGQVRRGDEIPRKIRYQSWDTGITGKVARTARSFRTGNVKDVPEYAEWYTSTVSEMAVALFNAAGEVIGVLNMESPAPNAFGQEDEALARNFADVAAWVLGRVWRSAILRMLRELHEVAQEEAPEGVEGRAPEDAILTPILRQINALMGEGTSSTIHLYDEETQVFTASSSEGPLREQLRFPPRGKGEGGTARFVTERKQPLFLTDVGNPPAGYPTIREALQEDGVISYAALPLIREGKVIGVLFINMTQPMVFTPSLRGYLATVAGQVAIALENALFVGELRERAQRLEALQRVTAAVSEEPLTLKPRLTAIVNNVSEAFGAVDCTVRSYNPVTGELGERVSSHELSAVLLSEPRPDGTTHYVLQGESGNPLYIENTAEGPGDGKPNLRKEFIEVGVKSAAYLPLVHEGEIRGILYLNFSFPQHFSENEKRVFELFATQAAAAIHNAQQYEAQIEAIQGISEAIAAFREQEDILEYILHSALTILGQTDAGEIQLIREATDELETVARSGSIANPAYETITLDQGITGWVARHGKPRFEPDVTEAEEYLGLFEGIKSEIAVPIQRSGKTIGVLNIENAKENALNENHLHLAEAFADLIAVAIENQELYDQLQSQQRAQVNAIEEISRSIVSSFERETILEGILESTVTLMGEANLGNIRLVDEVTGDLVVEAQHGEAVGKSHDRIPKGQGITGYVAEFGESLLVSDVNDVSSLPEGVEYVRFLADTRSELAVPMKKEDEVIGVLNIEHPRPNAFTEEDQHLVEAVAGLSVVALENARLHQELQAMHQELQDKRINEMKALNDLEGQLADLEINL